MRLIGMSLAAVLLCACSPASDAPTPVAAANAPDASSSDSVDIEPTVDAPPPVHEPGTPATARSEYSSLAVADCKLTERLEETGDTTHRCPGVANYVLDMHDSDARMSLDVIADGAQPQSLEFWSVASGAFSNLGPRVEWRYPAEAKQPNALIVRYDAFEQPEQPERPTSYLLVVKLAASDSCLVAKLPPGPGQNESARVAADKAQTSACLTPR
ncbi:hypothetical protein SAMN05421546_2318 [Solilutibacter tolerans]|uniref:DUF3558 domain-containing protein n=2 Tax=Solilutibacter tolerans TaxID=1604334 RepID=A0A1N6XR38_9GAMM|nr:hypothetical protein SAMN05421546_2318 [Lysobacter tolerans]